MSIASPVKWLHSGMAGAPALVGTTAGTMLAVLDACLKDGFGLVSVTSIVVVGNVATVTVAVSHSADVNTVVSLAGVTTPSALNGEWRVKAVTTTTIVFDTTGIADQTATLSSASVKMAPLGWTAAFTGTNLRAYRAPNVLGTRMFYRFDDTGIVNLTKVVGYESMSDVNTGVGPFPTVTQLSGGSLQPKRAGTWFVIGDDYGFYVGVKASGAAGYAITYFGDLIGERPGDAYNAINAGYTALDPLANAGFQPPGLEGGTAQAIILSTDFWYMPRSYTQIGGSVAAAKLTLPWVTTATSNTWSGLAVALHPFPDPVSNAMRFAKQYAYTGGLRGAFPGFSLIPQILNGAFPDRTVMSGTDDMAGKTLVFHSTGSYSGATNAGGAVAFDQVGPWR